MFEYQKTDRFFAQIAEETEDLAVAELKEFGIKKVRQIYHGAWFKTDLEHIYRINYYSRLITRILAPLLTFDCHSTKYLSDNSFKNRVGKITSLQKIHLRFLQPFPTVR